MGEELKEKHPAWVPETPAKRDRARTARDCSIESKNGGMPDNRKMKSTDDVEALNRKPRKRTRMKKHRPKVFNESKHVKLSTPKPQTPKPARHVKRKTNLLKDDNREVIHDYRKQSCKRKLEFDKEMSFMDQKNSEPYNGINKIAEQKLRSSNRSYSLQVYGTVKSPKIFKRRRMIRKRMSLNKLIRLVGMIHEISMCECVSTVLNLTWMNSKRRRSRTLTHRQGVSSFCCVEVQDESAQHMAKNKLVEHSKRPQDDVVGMQHAATEKSIEHSKRPQDDVVGVQNMAAKTSVERCKRPRDVVSNNRKFQNRSSEFRDCTCGAKTDILEPNLEFNASFHQPEDIMCKCGELNNEQKNVESIQDDAFKEALVDFATQKMESLYIGDESQKIESLYIGDGSQKTESLYIGDGSNQYFEEDLFSGRIDSFVARMRIILGNRSFSRWKGSVVDSVVGVFLAANVGDNLSRIDYMIHETQQVEIDEPLSGESEESNPNNQVEVDVENGNKTNSTIEVMPGRKKRKVKKKQEKTINWDNLRTYYSKGISGKREDHNADSVNWEAVRQTSLGELAKVIEQRGMSNQIAGRIKNFLDRLVRDHGTIDLEWLRNVPPEKAKGYLDSIDGLGLKSGECVRLLSLYQRAFPIDVNVGRVVVRLGWVKLGPLPEGVLLHLLNDYPMLDKVQEYIWPRICNRDELTLYELHCYLNAFSKAFCTKKKPNCNACPLKGECKHYASILASSRLHLEGSQAENMASESFTISSQEAMVNGSPPKLKNSDTDAYEGRHNSRCSQPIIEFPASPERASTEPLGGDIEDFGCESEIPTIILNSKEFSENPPTFVDNNDNISKALVALSPRVASIPMPKLKHVKRLRTEHLVYELPDSHPLLAGFEKREPEDPCPYLLAIWTTKETTDSPQESKKGYNCQESMTCGVGTCNSGDIVQCQKDQRVQGTILIPCRTANRGRFPLNGTYFQINEVFADHASSQRPIDVPREWIWALRRQTLYCGTSITSICKGMSLKEIICCFQGYICIRGFDVKTRGRRPLANKFHVCKTSKSVNE